MRHFGQLYKMLPILFLTILACSAILYYSAPLQTRTIAQRHSINSLEDLHDLVNAKEGHLIQISLKGCPYCEALNKVEDSITTEKQFSIIYEYTVIGEETPEEKAFFNRTFAEFKYYPSVFYVQNGMVLWSAKLDENMSNFPNELRQLESFLSEEEGYA